MFWNNGAVIATEPRRTEESLCDIVTTLYAQPDVPHNCPQVVWVWGPFWVKHAWDVNGGKYFSGTPSVLQRENRHAPLNVKHNVVREAHDTQAVSARLDSHALFAETSVVLAA